MRFKTKPSATALAFYILSLLLVIYTLVSLVHTHQYILTLLSTGQLLPRGNAYNIFNYYMTNAVQYLIYAAIFAGIAILLDPGFLKELFTKRPNRVEILPGPAEPASFPNLSGNPEPRPAQAGAPASAPEPYDDTLEGFEEE